MKELVILAEIERSEKLNPFTAYEAGIWRTVLSSSGDMHPFMEDNIGSTIVRCNNVIIDHVEYEEVTSLPALRATANREWSGYWYNAGSVIYVRFPYYNPPFVYYSHLYGVLFGFTNNKPLLKDGKMYLPSLLTAPKITQSADSFSYDQMKFNSETVTLKNTDGQFDEADKLFGNEFNLLIGTMPEEKDEQPEHIIRMIEEAGDEKAVAAKLNTNEYIRLITDKTKTEDAEFKILAQYYIENLSVSLDKADFKLNDKRERLARKIPFRKFTNDPLKAVDDCYWYYPDIDDNYLDKDMQEVYGHCYGVPGVCLDGKKVFENVAGGALKQNYRFRFSGKIARVDRIQVKMTAGEIPDSPQVNSVMKYIDGWTTVYQLVKHNNGYSADDWNTGYPNCKPGIGNDAVDFSRLSNGEILIRWDVAKQGGKRENGINEVRIDGIFIAFDKFTSGTLNGTPRATPLEILKDIMYKYADVSFNETRFNITEIKELNQLDDFEIGVMFDKSVSVYEAIEKLQSGSVLGFLLQVYGDRFTARLDNPNRRERDSISRLDIINLHEVVVDWNAGQYGSYTNMEYAYDCSEKVYRNYIDRNSRNKILELHRVDKEWNNKTLLVNEKDAKLKSDILLEDFEEMCPIIRNIKLEGKKWHDLRVFDIQLIDFSIPGEEKDKFPRHLIRLIEEAGGEKAVAVNVKTGEYISLEHEETETHGKREFAGKLRCKLLNVELDTETGVTTIEARVTNISKAWRDR